MKCGNALTARPANKLVKSGFKSGGIFPASGIRVRPRARCYFFCSPIPRPERFPVSPSRRPQSHLGLFDGQVALCAVEYNH
jgi:hypothetical protein